MQGVLGFKRFCPVLSGVVEFCWFSRFRTGSVARDSLVGLGFYLAAWSHFVAVRGGLSGFVGFGRLLPVWSTLNWVDPVLTGVVGSGRVCRAWQLCRVLETDFAGSNRNSSGLVDLAGALWGSTLFGRVQVWYI